MVALHENHVWFETRAFRGVELIPGAAGAFFIKAEEVVAHGHPYFARLAVDPHGRQDALEDRSATFLLLAQDLAADRLGRWSGFQRGVLHVPASEAEAVVLAHGRLRRIRETVEKVALRVGGQLADVQEAVEIGSLGKRLRVAEFAHIAAILVE